MKEAQRNKKSKFSVVVIAQVWRDDLFDLTKKTIESILDNTYDFELIVVDNGSSHKECVKYLQDKADVYVRNAKNEGYPQGVNQGLRLATGDYIAVCNNDIVVEEGWLNKLAAVVDRPDIGAVCPLVVLHKDHDWFERKPMVVDKKKNFEGSCWVIHRRVLDQIGYLDEYFSPVYCEDTDYWHRMYLNKMRVVQYLDVVIEHKQNQTMKRKPENDKLESEAVKKFIAKWGIDPIKEYH